MGSSERYQEFVRLLQEATPQILAFLDALLLNWNDAEDVFQEASIVLWQKFDEFQPGTNFLGWALRIAQNKAMHSQRNRSRRLALWKPDLQASLMATIVEGRATSAEGALGALSGCVARLAETDRRLVELCYGEDIPVRQIATDLGRSPQSVHNSLRRIRTALLRCVQRDASGAASIKGEQHR